MEDIQPRLIVHRQKNKHNFQAEKKDASKAAF